MQLVTRTPSVSQMRVTNFPTLKGGIGVVLASQPWLHGASLSRWSSPFGYAQPSSETGLELD